MKKRLFAFALALSMLLVTACTGSENPVDTVDTTADTVEVDENAITPDIPDDLYYDGRSFRILCTLDAWYGPADLDEFELDKMRTFFPRHTISAIP